MSVLTAPMIITQWANLTAFPRAASTKGSALIYRTAFSSGKVSTHEPECSKSKKDNASNNVPSERAHCKRSTDIKASSNETANAKSQVNPPSRKLLSHPSSKLYPSLNFVSMGQFLVTDSFLGAAWPTHIEAYAAKTVQSALSGFCVMRSPSW